MNRLPVGRSFEELYEHAPCAYLIADAGGCLRRVNQTFLDWTGRERADLEAGGSRLPDLLTVGGRLLFETHLAPMLRMQGMVREIAVEIVCADGHRLPVILNGVLRGAADGGEPAMLVTLFDTAERRSYERELLQARNAERDARRRTEKLQMQLEAANAELRRRADVDALTGIANRRALQRLLAQSTSRAQRHDAPFGVALLDIDHFKRINDTYGHRAGDAVLRTVAERISACGRAEDVVGRWGGEEFLLLAGDTDAAGLARLCERVRTSVCGQPIDYRGGCTTVTASIGWAIWSQETPETLVHRADEALYRAKGNGRNCVTSAEVAVAVA